MVRRLVVKIVVFTTIYHHTIFSGISLKRRYVVVLPSGYKKENIHEKRMLASNLCLDFSYCWIFLPVQRDPVRNRTMDSGFIRIGRSNSSSQYSRNLFGNSTRTSFENSAKPVARWAVRSHFRRISPMRSAITAPFSGEVCCIVEYEIKQGDTPGGDYSGYLMAPSSIMTTQGTVRLVGFPMLAEVSSSNYKDEKSSRRAGEYLASCKFEEKASNPIALVSQLNSVLMDDDGDVKADFVSKNATLHLDLEDDDEEKQDGAEAAPQILVTPAEKITEKLLNSDYVFKETIIRSGDEVTACGTYRQSKQAIDIGSGIKNLSHSLRMGSVAESIRSLLMRSTITAFIFSAIFVVANWQVLPRIGIDPNALLKTAKERLKF